MTDGKDLVPSVIKQTKTNLLNLFGDILETYTSNLCK